MTDKKQARKDLKKLHKLQKESAKASAKLKKLNKKAQKLVKSVASADAKIARLELASPREASRQIVRPQAGLLTQHVNQTQFTQNTLGDSSTSSESVAVYIPVDDTAILDELPSIGSKFAREDWRNVTTSQWARSPYKSNPCKKCPAKAGGLCKCAIAKIKM